MKNKMKKVGIVILIGVLQFGIQFGVKEYKDINRYVKKDLYRDFNGFGDELEKINNDIAGILIANPKEHKKIIKKSIGYRKILWDFFRANEYVFGKKDLATKDEYLYMLIDANDNIELILKDNDINEEEKKYLNTLFLYNEELIHLYKSSNIEYNNYKKKIKDAYIDFSKKADEILKDETYSILEDYGKKEEQIEKVENPIDLKTAQKITQEIVDKVLPVDVKLSFDEKSQNNPTKYKFNRVYLREHTYYDVEYDNKYNRVYIHLGSYLVDERVFSENKLNKIADEIISEFYDDTYVKCNGDIKRVIVHREPGEKEYHYIKKIGNTYDERKRFGLRLKGNGDVNSFYIQGIMSDENIPTPKYSKDEILSKIDQKEFIKKCILIRNEEGKLEYEVHLDINGVLYSKVFDGDTGEEKYFGRNVRLYEGK